ncbi:MAG: nicotinate (nicotinamide) nucleotide adenylyltransferase [Leadbetterella sp.]
MKVGLFFGSFNPIHVGHLILANTIAENSDLNQVWFIVSPQNPFKKNLSLLHEFDRYTMVQKAIEDKPNLRVSDIEFSLPKPSYTIDTLTLISAKYPQHEFTLIIGEDNLGQFKNWKNHDQILNSYRLLVYPRPNSPTHDFHSHPSVQIVKAPLLDISSTYIRNAIHEGKSISYLVTEPVERHIIQKKFYLS